MRRISAPALALILTGCATGQNAAPETPPAQAPAASQQNSVIGLTVQELAGRFGSPALQIREGSSLKMQFRGPRCVMDAYLYPSGTSGALKVTHVDTRLPTGADIDQAACIFALRNRAI